MRIENAIVLQKQIDKGSHFKLENGVLKTESWFSHAVRNLRSTPEEIRERNTALHAAMAAVLRRSSLHNVADAFARKVGADDQIDQHLMSPETRSALT
ncbi:MAG: hypothetical protein HUK26_09815, partial [Duodenibacillus sp.]|nr:hypothetical protein [Duodenibacillus sp.]